MLLPKVLSHGTVCLLTFTLGAALAHAQAGARRAPERAPLSRAVGVAVPRAAAIRPVRAQRMVFARPVRRAPVVRVGPAIVRGVPVARYRSYVYRPRLSVGVYLGSAYRPYRYSYPYAYPYRYAYPYPYPAPAYGFTGGVAYGGVRLQVTPRDATVYVDGYYVGTVDDFDGALQRVPLEAGPHHIEVRAPGYEPLAFDVNVLPNQTVKYRGDLLPIRP